MRRVVIPPRQKACIHAIRDMMGALVSSGKRARKRMEQAAERYGITSDEYYAAKAGNDEAERMVKSLGTTLEIRLYELESPFKRRMF